MGNKLEVLRGFCLSPGKDVQPGDELDEAEVGKNRADQLCGGASPKCRRIPGEVEAKAAADEGGDAGGNADDSGPKPKTKAEKKAAAAAKKGRKHVPGNLRHR
jgi:hypothetical protein